MSLTNNQIKFLRKLAHSRKVIVIVGGAGLTENVLLEIDNALNTHELVKVRINAGEREERSAMIEQNKPVNAIVMAKRSQNRESFEGSK